TNSRDNTNSTGYNLCKYVNELCTRFVGSVCVEHVSTDQAFTPSAGQPWLRLFGDDPSSPDFCPDVFLDAEDRIEWSDLAPGSRNPLFFDGLVSSGSFGPLGTVFCEYFAHQRFPTTIIPFVSAAGTQGPLGSSNYAERPSPFTEPIHIASISRVAGAKNVLEDSELINRLKAFPPGCTSPETSPAKPLLAAPRMKRRNATRSGKARGGE